MTKKRYAYLSIIVILLLALTAWLFYQKSIELKVEVVSKELHKSLLSFIEHEEIYPKNLDKIEFDDRGLKVTYEYLEHGRGCRYTIEGKTFELWDEVR